MASTKGKKVVEKLKNFIQQSEYEEALRLGEQNLLFDANNFQVIMCVAKAAFHLEMYGKSEEMYEKASLLKPDLPFAWKGLLDIYTAKNNLQSKIRPLTQLISISQSNNKISRAQQLLFELMNTQEELGNLDRANDICLQLVSTESKYSLFAHKNESLPTLLALLLKRLQLLESLNDKDCLLDAYRIMFNIASDNRWNDTNDPLFSKISSAVDKFVNILQLDIENAEFDKLNLIERMDCDCLQILNWFPLAKSPAEYLLYRREDGVEMNVDEIEDNILKFHSTCGIGYFILGKKSLIANDGKEALSFFESCVKECSDFFPVWLSLANSYICSGPSFNPSKTLTCIKKARTCVDERFSKYGITPSPNSFAGDSVSMLEASAYVKQGEVDTALLIYDSILLDDPMNLHVALEKVELLFCSGDVNAAQEILDLFSFNEKFASDSHYLECCGWLHYLKQNDDQARTYLEISLEKSKIEDRTARGLSRLADVYWRMGGIYREQKGFYFNCMVNAIKLDPYFKGSFTKLGNWYEVVENDCLRAEKCYCKALVFNSSDATAGRALCQMYLSRGEKDRAFDMVKRITEENDDTLWGWLQLSQFEVEEGDNEAAVSCLHKAIRLDVSRVSSWVALGHVYQRLGKYLAAQKAYLKSLEIANESQCFSILYELAHVESVLGLYEEALERLRNLIIKGLSNIYLLKLYAECLYEEAKLLCSEGFYGRAASNIKEGVAVLQRVVETKSNDTSIKSLWKLLGDMYCFSFFLSPADFNDSSCNHYQFLPKNLVGWWEFLTGARNSYLKAIEIEGEESSASLHYDLAVACFYEMQALVYANCQVQEEIHSREKRSLNYILIALSIDSMDPDCWNSYGTLQDNILLKQYGFIRAIQLSNLDSAWVNLATLYLKLNKPSLARQAFSCIQSNAMMWVGNAMLRKNKKRSNDNEVIAAYSCAIELEYQLDALIGYASCYLRSCNNSDSIATKEMALFTITKYLERDQQNPAAYNILGLIQMKFGLFEVAVHSFGKALYLLHYFSSIFDDGIKYLRLMKNVELSYYQCMLKTIRKKEAIAYFTENNCSPPQVSEVTLACQSQVYMFDQRYSEALQKLSSMCIDQDMVLLVTVKLLYISGKHDELRKLIEATTSSKNALLLQALVAICSLLKANTLLEMCLSSLREVANTSADVDILKLMELVYRNSGLQDAAFRCLCKRVHLTDSVVAWTTLGLGIIQAKRLKNTIKIDHHYQVNESHSKSVFYYNSLLEVLFCDINEHAAQKLYFLHPDNVIAVLLSAGVLMKKYMLLDNENQSTELLDRAIDLLKHANDLNNSDENENVKDLLGRLFGLSYTLLNNERMAQQYLGDQFECLTKARISSRLGLKECLHLYTNALTKVDRFQPQYKEILYEMVALCEWRGLYHTGISILREIKKINNETIGKSLDDNYILLKMTLFNFYGKGMKVNKSNLTKVLNGASKGNRVLLDAIFAY